MCHRNHLDFIKKTPHLDVGALLPGAQDTKHINCGEKGPRRLTGTVLHVHVVHVAIDDFDVFLLLSHIHHQRGDLGYGIPEGAGHEVPRSPGGRAMKSRPNFVQPRYETREMTKSSAHKGSQAI